MKESEFGGCIYKLRGHRPAAMNNPINFHKMVSFRCEKWEQLFELAVLAAANTTKNKGKVDTLVCDAANLDEVIEMRGWRPEFFVYSTSKKAKSAAFQTMTQTTQRLLAITNGNAYSPSDGPSEPTQQPAFPKQAAPQQLDIPMQSPPPPQQPWKALFDSEACSWKLVRVSDSVDRWVF